MLRPALLSLTPFALVGCAQTPLPTPAPFTGDLTHWAVEQMPGGRVTTRDGALVIEDKAGSTVWLREKLTTPVEITYEATVVSAG